MTVSGSLWPQQLGALPTSAFRHRGSDEPGCDGSALAATKGRNEFRALGPQMTPERWDPRELRHCVQGT